MPSLYQVLIDDTCDVLLFEHVEHKEVLKPLDGNYKINKLPKDCLPVRYARQSSRRDNTNVLTTEIGGLVLRDEVLASNERLYYALLGCEQIALRFQKEFFLLLNPIILNKDIKQYNDAAVPPLLFHLNGESVDKLYCCDGFVNNDSNFVFLSKACGLSGMRFEFIRSWSNP